MLFQINRSSDSHVLPQINLFDDTFLLQSPIKGAVNNYDPHNYDDFYPEEYGGWGGNQNGGNDRRGGGFGGGRGGGGPSRMPGGRGPPGRGGGR